jgi:hypothetical protein
MYNTLKMLVTYITFSSAPDADAASANHNNLLEIIEELVIYLGRIAEILLVKTAEVLKPS